MASNENLNPWAPFDTYKDCSQGICSLSCPQWCYMIFQPPPPFNLGDDNNSGTDFSPLIIAAISILASAFVLVSYYTVISKYCKRRSDFNRSVEIEENREELNGVWRRSSEGLDESVIESIAVCKYRKSDGLVEGTDCSVCLNEFQEDETLRLLPKCNHAFHLPCIDTWLKSHSSCPLCRYDLRSTNLAADPVDLAVEHRRESETASVIPDLESGFRILRESVVDLVGDENPQIRRSVSLDDLRGGEDGGGGSSIGNDGEDNKLSNGIGVLDLVCNPVTMKRSISTGRFVFTRYGKGRNSVIIPN